MKKLIAACLPPFSKKPVLFFAAMLSFFLLTAQTYPAPEYANEVYGLKKSTPHLLTRLEKSLAKQESKTKMGGFAGVEFGYTVEGTKSPIRLVAANNLSFVFSTGSASSRSSDSALREAGIDPSMMSGMGMDPARMISLYQTSADKGVRKIYLAKNSGMFGGKNKSSDKFSFSVKQVREGYWELVPDKPLKRGEYAFVVMSYNTDGSHTIFSFGVD